MSRGLYRAANYRFGRDLAQIVADYASPIEEAAALAKARLNIQVRLLNTSAFHIAYTPYEVAAASALIGEITDWVLTFPPIRNAISWAEHEREYYGGPAAYAFKLPSAYECIRKGAGPGRAGYRCVCGAVRSTPEWINSAAHLASPMHVSAFANEVNEITGVVERPADFKTTRTLQYMMLWAEYLAREKMATTLYTC